MYRDINMIISDVELFLVETPYTPFMSNGISDENEMNAAKSSRHSLESLIIKIKTECGLVGWGEAFGHALNSSTMTFLRDRIAPFLIGKKCDDIKSLMRNLSYSVHSYGRGGVVVYALSAVDMALWDLKAKFNDMPLYKLIGGENNSIELYPSLPCFDGDAELLTGFIENLIEQGYKSIKLHEHDIQCVKKLGERFSSFIDLMVDTNCIWSDIDSESYMKQSFSSGIAFVEEPVFPPENLSQYRKLSLDSNMSVAAGENICNEYEFIEAIRSNLLDVYQPSVSKIGGISSFLNIVEAFKQFGTGTLLPHCFYYGPGMLATAHLMTILPKRVPMEVPYLNLHNHLHYFTKYSPIMQLSDEPGLGFSPNEAMISKFKVY